MARHQKYADDSGNQFNCAFTSEFIEISRQNCLKGSAYLLGLKVAVCIRDTNGRLADYGSEIAKSNESVHVWLRKEYEKGTSMVGAIKAPRSRNLYFQAPTDASQRAVIDSISSLQTEILMLGILLPPINNLGLVRMVIVDLIKGVTGVQRKKAERLTSPWFSIPNVWQYKFAPDFITHNNVGFQMSLHRLQSTMVALRDTLNTCAAYSLVDVHKINKALDRLANAQIDNIADKSALALDKAYLGGLRSLHFSLPEAAKSLYEQIMTWDAISADTRDKILAELGAKVDGGKLVFVDKRRRSQSPPPPKKRRMS